MDQFYEVKSYALLDFPYDESCSYKHCNGTGDLCHTQSVHDQGVLVSRCTFSHISHTCTFLMALRFLASVSGSVHTVSLQKFHHYLAQHPDLKTQLLQN
jgi:hypothetical protein